MQNVWFVVFKLEINIIGLKYNFSTFGQRDNMEMYDYLMVSLSAFGIPTILFFLFKKYFGGIIDSTFSRELESFKQKLEIATEEIRFDFQKKIHNYNLFIQRKFTAYEELQRLMLTAEAHIRSLYGVRREPTFEEYNDEDFRTLLEKNNFPKGKIEELLSIDNHNEFIHKLRKQMRFKEIRDSEISINELRNYYWLSKMYLSEKIDIEIQTIMDKMLTLQLKYEMLEELTREIRQQNQDEDEDEKARKLKEEIQKLVPEFVGQVKKELSVF